MTIRKRAPTTKLAERGLVITRVFDAPRNLVFRAWAEPERVKRWWGPRGFTMPVCDIDFRPGGAFHFCMRSPEGEEVWIKKVYREIVEPERLVFTSFFADEQGNQVEPTSYGLPADWPTESLTTVTFAEHKGKTTLTLELDVPESLAERAGVVQNWNETLDRLAEHLASNL